MQQLMGIIGQTGRDTSKRTEDIFTELILLALAAAKIAKIQQSGLKINTILMWYNYLKTKERMDWGRKFMTTDYEIIKNKISFSH